MKTNYRVAILDRVATCQCLTFNKSSYGKEIKERHKSRNVEERGNEECRERS